MILMLIKNLYKMSRIQEYLDRLNTITPEQLLKNFLNINNESFTEEEYLEICIYALRGCGEVIKYIDNSITLIRDKYFELCELAIKSDQESVIHMDYKRLSKEQYTGLVFKAIDQVPFIIEHINIDHLTDGLYETLCEKIIRTKYFDFSWIKKDKLDPEKYTELEKNYTLYKILKETRDEKNKVLTNKIWKEYEEISTARQQLPCYTGSLNVSAIMTQACINLTKKGEIELKDIAIVRPMLFSPVKFTCDDSNRYMAIVKAAMEQNIEEFRNVNPEWIYSQHYYNLCLEAMKQNPESVFEYINLKQLSQKQYYNLCLCIATNYPEKLHYVQLEYLNKIPYAYENLCLQALQRDPESVFKYIEPELITKEQYYNFCWYIATNYPEEFKYIKSEWLSQGYYDELCLYITTNYPEEFKYIKPECLTEPCSVYEKLCWQALQKDPIETFESLVIRWISEESYKNLYQYYSDVIDFS